MIADLIQMKTVLYQLQDSKLGTKTAAEQRKFAREISKKVSREQLARAANAALLIEQSKKIQGTIKEKKVTLKIEENVHKLLVATSDYLLEHDPTKAIQAVITDILQKLVNDNIVSFNIKTIEKRNQLETYFTVTRQYGSATIEQPILECTGGGAADVAFFILRIILLVNHPTDPDRILFADEPVTNLSPDRRDYFMDLLHKIVDEFDIQLIMVTNEDEYAARAGLAIRFTLEGDVTRARVQENNGNE